MRTGSVQQRIRWDEYSAERSERSTAPEEVDPTVRQIRLSWDELLIKCAFPYSRPPSPYSWTGVIHLY
jgi:hypothetical protein